MSPCTVVGVHPGFVTEVLLESKLPTAAKTVKGAEIGRSATVKRSTLCGICKNVREL